jgi:hypothetical protein
MAVDDYRDTFKHDLLASQHHATCVFRQIESRPAPAVEAEIFDPV